MPPLNTDKMQKGARKFATQVGVAGVTDAVTTTIPLTSTTGLPTDTACVVILDRVDTNGVKTPAKEESVKGTVSGLNLINCIRGYEGTAQSHAAGAVVENRLTAAQHNEMIDALLLSHNQDGTPKSSVLYGVSATGTDSYAATLAGITAAPTAGATAIVKADVANTGAASFNASGFGAVAIKKNGTTDLATGDVTAGALMVLAHDGTYWQLVSSVPTTTNPTAPTNYTPAAAGTATLDLAVNKRNTITMPAGNITIALSNVVVGNDFYIDITQDGVGSRTVTWFTTIKWAGGVAPTLTTTLNKRDTFGFTCTGSGTYDGYIIGKNI